MVLISSKTVVFWPIKKRIKNSFTSKTPPPLKLNSRKNTDLANPIQTFMVNMLLLKNLQFSPNDYETQSKISSHKYLNLTEFHNHWVKIVNFIIKAYVVLCTMKVLMRVPRSVLDVRKMLDETSILEPLM